MLQKRFDNFLPESGPDLYIVTYNATILNSIYLKMVKNGASKEEFQT